MKQGLTDAFISELNTAMTSIAADNQTQYEIKENRKAPVQSNSMVFSELYTDIINDEH
jgi:hypothetical protein